MPGKEGNVTERPRWNAKLIDCAIERMTINVWLGSYIKIGEVYVVRRGTRLGDMSQDQLQLYCVSSNTDPAPIFDILESPSFKDVRSVILIGERNELATHTLEGAGFRVDWQTAVYFMRVDSLPNLTVDYRKLLPYECQFVDIKRESLAVANSFEEDLKISEPALRDTSFINRMLFYRDMCVGKIQLILCPPHGAFCVLVAIREDQRRQGYFSLMMKAAAAWAHERGLPQMALFSGSCANNINLYPKQGYTKIGTYCILIK
jgi:GNAT superfamily N-acetyltransferase